MILLLPLTKLKEVSAAAWQQANELTDGGRSMTNIAAREALLAFFKRPKREIVHEAVAAAALVSAPNLTVEVG